MSLFSDIISSVGNAYHDVFGGGNNNDNNNPYKKQQNNNTSVSAPSLNVSSGPRNSGGNLSVGTPNSSNVSVSPPKPIAPTIMPSTVDTSNLAAKVISPPQPQNAPPQPQDNSLFHQLTHNAVTNDIGGVVKGLAGSFINTGQDVTNTIGNVESTIGNHLGIPNSGVQTNEQQFGKSTLGIPTQNDSLKNFATNTGQVGLTVLAPEVVGAVAPAATGLASTLLPDAAERYLTATALGGTGDMASDAAGAGFNNLVKYGTGVMSGAGINSGMTALNGVAANKSAGQIAASLPSAALQGAVFGGVIPAVGDVGGTALNKATNFLNDNKGAEGGAELAASEAAPVATNAPLEEPPPPETGTKPITEEPTNAPTSERTPPPPAETNVPESGTKPVDVPPPAPAPAPTPPPITTETPPTPLPKEPQVATVPTGAEATPPQIQQEQQAVQQAVNKAVDNPPATTPPPEASAPAISQAEEKAVQAAASPTQDAVNAIPALEKSGNIDDAAVQEIYDNAPKTIKNDLENHFMGAAVSLKRFGIASDYLAKNGLEFSPDGIQPIKDVPVASETPAPSVPERTNNVINNKDVPTPAETKAPEPAPKPLTEMERNPNAVGNLPDRQKLFSSKVQAIRNTNTESGAALADKIDAADARHVELRANWMHELKPVFDLSKSDFRDAWDVQEGKLNPNSVSQSARDAAATLKEVMPDVQKTADKASVVEGNLGDSYMPHTFKDALPSGPTVNMPKGINTTAKTFGNLEKERLTNAQNYERTPNALMGYIDKAAQRVGQSENFGAKNETAQALLAKIGAEGGDQGTATEAFQNYMRTEFPNTTSSKIGRAVRGAFGVARLPTAAISHIGQTSNTAVDAGIGNTLKGWAEHLSSNPEAADFVDRTGVNNPQSLGHYQDDYTSVKGIQSRLTAPGMRPVMQMNRSVTALAYREYGNALAKAGDVAKLQDLGVTGDIGKTLTDNQELQAARGGVQKAMFSGSNAQTPIKAETEAGRYIGQYRNAYALPQAKFIVNSVIKEAGNGNLAPLARYLTVSAGVSGASILAKNAISGHKESAGNVAADVVTGLGGIPGEMAGGLARYGAKNVAGTIAGDVAPAAGEFVKVANAVQNSLGSKNAAPIERYGLKTIPFVGNRLADKLTPYAAGSSKAQVAGGAKQSSPGIYQVKAKNGSSQFATLDGKNMKNYSTLTDAQAAQAKNEFKYSSAGEKISSDNAQQALDKNNFIKSGQQEQSIHGMVYQSKGNGKVTSMQQKDYDYKTANDAMRNAKTNHDLKGYVSGATSLLGNIGWQLKHATLTDSQRSTLENTATKTEGDLAKYEGYGGFAKGRVSYGSKYGGGSKSSGGGKAASPSGGVTLPSSAVSDSNLKSTAIKYATPTLAVAKPDASRNGNPFVRSITTNSGVK